MNRPITTATVLAAFITTLMFSAYAVFSPDTSPAADSYWLWGGKTFEDLPDSETVYVLQGTISELEGEPGFLHQGVYPHPVIQKLVLVFRFETLDDSPRLIELMHNIAWQWETQGAEVLGFQLDYDSPSAQLLGYRNVLDKIRNQLDEKYLLSITGLGDWLFSADQAVLLSTRSSVDEIVFQLYRGSDYEPLYDYLIALKKQSFDFKLGLLKDHRDNEKILKALSDLKGLQGLIYF